MTDDNVDDEERSRHGDAFVHAAQELAKVHPVFKELASAVEEKTRELAEALAEAREKGAQGVSKAKGSIIPAARAALSETEGWLKAHRKIDKKEFFPEGLEKLGKSADAIRKRLLDAAEGFTHHLKVPEAKERKAALERLAHQLGGAVERGSAALGERADASPAVALAREEWRRVYEAAKHASRGLLELKKPAAEVEKQMRRLFADLHFPSRGKGRSRDAGADAPEDETGGGPPM